MEPRPTDPIERPRNGRDPDATDEVPPDESNAGVNDAERRYGEDENPG